jgi:sodium-dependent dicarboxylate transporter 2/3/5
MVILMMTWWVTEAVPIPVTALLPLVILPVFGVSSIGQAAAPFSSPTIMLLMGGFIIATSIERWGLHARIALNIVSKAGIHPAGIVGGFMLAGAVLSMWISNTATTIMLAPIAVSVAYAILGNSAHRAPFTIAILLGLAYGASIGGIATPVGTPTNLIVIGYLEQQLGISISFAEWMAIGVPVVVLMLPACWLTVTRLAIHIKVEDAAQGQDTVHKELARLGPISTPERRVLIVFSFIAAAWILRQPLSAIEIGQLQPLAGLTDHVIAIAGAIVLFLIPAGSSPKDGTRLLDWESASRIPWGILLLFGGGLSMASALSQTGLAGWIGGLLVGLTAMPLIVLIVALVAFVIFATEMMSNVAAASALLPVIGALALIDGADPVLLTMPIALAASCAFMFPIATGPNAIAFATGEVSIRQMAKVGFVLNLFGIVMVSGVIYFLAPFVSGAQ